MKILNCHIENFGKLHDYSIDFTDRENIICQENGWGKTTLAAFIRAMFYGLEGERKRSVEENEVKRYKPWQGGIFGGKLTFEVEGKQYVVTRNFNDTNGFELRDAKTNMLSSDYSHKLGEELFKVNRQSFMSTVFVGQNACETTVTDDINAKLGNITDSTNDINSFEAANEILTKHINNLNPNRVTGSLSKRKDKIGELERVVQDGNGIEDSIKEYQKKLEDESRTYEKTKMDIDITSAKQVKVSRAKSIQSKKREWVNIQESCKKKKEELRIVRDRFPKQIPDKEEVEDKINECVKLENAKSQMETFSFVDIEKERLSNLENLFKNDVPNTLSIDNMINKAQNMEKLKGQMIKCQMTKEETKEYEDLRKSFENDNETISAISMKWNNRNTKSAALPSNQAALVALKASLKAEKAQGNKTLLIVLGVMAVIVGLIMAAAMAMIPGVAVMVAGAMLLMMGLVVNGNKDRAEEITSPEIERLQNSIKEDTEYIRKTDEEVEAFLTAHGKIFDESQVSYMLTDMSAEYYRYIELKKKADIYKESSIKEKIIAIGNVIEEYLQVFEIDIDESKYVETLYGLKNDVQEFISLSDKKRKLDKATMEYDIVDKALRGFFEKYGYENILDYRKILTEIRDNILDYAGKEDRYQKSVDYMEEFKAKNDISLFDREEDVNELPELEELSERLKSLTMELEISHKAIVDYNKAIDELQEKYDQWDENKILLEEEKRIYNEEKQKYNHISSAKKYLTMAKENLTMRYAKPILESFSKYYEHISNNSSENIHIDANTVITVEEAGTQRATNTLSLGYRDLIGIALRVSLIDAMYKDETPVIIMDDPFVNLDDDKQRAARRLLSKIAERYQVIYFTCSKSRS